MRSLSRACMYVHYIFFSRLASRDGETAVLLSCLKFPFTIDDQPVLELQCFEKL